MVVVGSLIAVSVTLCLMFLLTGKGDKDKVA